LVRRRIDPIIAFAVILIVFGTLGGLAGYQVNVTQARGPQSDLMPTTAIKSAQPMSQTTVVGNDQPVSQVAAEANGDLAPSATAAPTASASPAEPTPEPQAAPVATPEPQAAPVATPTGVSKTVLVFRRTLRYKSRGDEVMLLQQRLRELGYFDYAEDTGYFGKLTEQAVARFQHDNGRPETGEVDARTVAALNRAAQARP
jgi:hypothetical protein